MYQSLVRDLSSGNMSRARACACVHVCVRVCVFGGVGGVNFYDSIER